MEAQEDFKLTLVVKLIIVVNSEVELPLDYSFDLPVRAD